MRSSPTAAVKVVLAVWAALALAPLASVCMGASCDLATGVRTAHCGSAAQSMLCCDRPTSQPLDITTSSAQHSGLVSRVERSLGVECPDRRGDLASVRVGARHGPPLYALFATFLI